MLGSGQHGLAGLAQASSPPLSPGWRPRGGRPLAVRVHAAKQAQPQEGEKRSWFEETRRGARPFKTVGEELEWRRKANREANNGVEQKHLYTEKWAGDQYRGSAFNFGTIVGLLFVLTPLGGLLFAYLSYGKLWG